MQKEEEMWVSCYCRWKTGRPAKSPLGGIRGILRCTLCVFGIVIGTLCLRVRGLWNQLSLCLKRAHSFTGDSAFDSFSFLLLLNLCSRRSSLCGRGSPGSCCPGVWTPFLWSLNRFSTITRVNWHSSWLGGRGGWRDPWWAGDSGQASCKAAVHLMEKLLGSAQVIPNALLPLIQVWRRIAEMIENGRYPCKGFIRLVACVGFRWSCEGLTSVHNEYTGWSL